jgi:hypothetical protein
MYSLEYIEIPKEILLQNTGVDVSMTTKCKRGIYL